MLQTIDRALTLLVDMNEDELMVSMQSRKVGGGIAPISEIMKKCKSIIRKAIAPKTQSKPIEEILQEVTNDCDAITQTYSEWIDDKKRLYFIEAILHITIIILEHEDSTIIKAMELNGKKGILNELTPQQVNDINPHMSLEGDYLFKVVSAACEKKGSCTIS